MSSSLFSSRFLVCLFDRKLKKFLRAPMNDYKKVFNMLHNFEFG
jgi:hypothetical protein